jgi:hypothetical protein
VFTFLKNWAARVKHVWQTACEFVISSQLVGGSKCVPVVPPCTLTYRYMHVNSPIHIDLTCQSV